MADIEEADGGPNRFVLGDDAGVRDGHLPPTERSECRSQFRVDDVDGSAKKFLCTHSEQR